MKRFLYELADMTGISVAILTVMIIFVSGSLAISYFAYPAYLSIQRESVEASKSFNDSRNDALLTYQSEYGRLEIKIAESSDNKQVITVYRTQQTAILDSMCHMIATMNDGTVSPTINQFIATNGGCE